MQQNITGLCCEQSVGYLKMSQDAYDATGSTATRGSSALKWTVSETTFYLLQESFCYLPAHILQSPLLRPASYLLPEIRPEILKPKGCFLGTGDSFYN